MSNEKFTKGPLVADLRGGCCAVYPVDRSEDTNGCHFDDNRNIYYSSKDSSFSGNYFGMCEVAQADAHLIAAAQEMYSTLRTIGLVISGQTEFNCDELNPLAIEALLAKARGEK